MTNSDNENVMTMITCDDNSVTQSIVNRCAISVGFEIVAEAHTAPELTHVVDAHRPDVVIVRHELTGISGAEVGKELLSAPDAPIVVLASPDPGAEALARHMGAFSAVDPTNAEAVTEVLREILEQLETGEKRAGDDRRVSPDRRIKQDWSKVFSERRGGADRRESDRRSND